MSVPLLFLLFTVFHVLATLWEIGTALHEYWQSPRADQDAQKLRQELLSLLWKCVHGLVLDLFLEVMKQLWDVLSVLLE